MNKLCRKACVLVGFAFLLLSTFQCTHPQTKQTKEKKKIDSVPTHLFGKRVLQGKKKLFPDSPNDSLKYYLVGSLLDEDILSQKWRDYLNWNISDERPPPSDAPLPKLFNYWSGRMDVKPQGLMDETTIDRLLSAWEDKRKIPGTGKWLFYPNRIYRNRTFLRHLPKKSEYFKKVRSLVESIPRDDRQKQSHSFYSIENWLVRHDPSYRDELKRWVGEKLERLQRNQDAWVRHSFSNASRRGPIDLFKNSVVLTYIKRYPRSAFRLIKKHTGDEEVANPQLAVFLYIAARELGKSKQVRKYEQRMTSLFLDLNFADDQPFGGFGSRGLGEGNQTKGRLLAEYLFQPHFRESTSIFKKLLRTEQFKHAAVAFDTHPGHLSPVLVNALTAGDTELKSGAVSFLVNSVRPEPDREKHQRKFIGGKSLIAEESTFGNDESVTVKVPVEHFQTLLNSVAANIDSLDRIPEEFQVKLVKLFTKARFHA